MKEFEIKTTKGEHIHSMMLDMVTKGVHIRSCAAYKESPRANRHIWFLPTRKANAEKPKEPVFFANARTETMKFETDKKNLK